MSRNKQFQWNSASFGLSQESIDMTRQMSVAMLEYGRTLWALQFDTASTMASETTRQFKDWLSSAAYNGNSPGQWPGLFQPRTQRLIEIAQGWLNVSSQATAEMNQLLGQALSASLALTGKNIPTYPEHERRRSAQVISFADRRRSADQSRARRGSNDSNDLRSPVNANRSIR